MIKKSLIIRIQKSKEALNLAKEEGLSITKACKTLGLPGNYARNTKFNITNIKNSDTIPEYKEYLDEYNSIIGLSRNLNEKGSDNEISTNKIRKYYTKEGDIVIENKTKRITSLEELLDFAEVDRDVWFVKDYTVNKWDVTAFYYKDGIKIPKTHENFQVKARLERIKNLSYAKTAAEIFNENIKKKTEYISHTIKYDKVNSGKLLEVSLFDLHFGKLAWNGETGENYDTKIARERLMSSLRDLLSYADVIGYDRILFPIGNDFFNSDTILNTTTGGTPQDEDLRWQKTFEYGSYLMVEAIEFLKSTGRPVDVIVIPGNHDFERSYYLGMYLSAWYAQDGMVSINNSANPRKYYRFGDVLLGFTHGSEEKESSLPMIMANDLDSRKLWSETKYHEWHLGHLHRKMRRDYATTLIEDLGVTVRILSSLSATEAWHHKKGFVGSNKAGEAFIWDEKEGLKAHLNSNYIIKK